MSIEVHLVGGYRLLLLQFLPTVMSLSKLFGRDMTTEASVLSSSTAISCIRIQAGDRQEEIIIIIKHQQME